MVSGCRDLTTAVTVARGKLMLNILNNHKPNDMNILKHVELFIVQSLSIVRSVIHNIYRFALFNLTWRT